MSIEQLISENAQLKDQVAELKIEYSALEFELSQLKKILFGSKSERFKPQQIDARQWSLFPEEKEQEATEEKEKEQITYSRSKPKKKKKHPGRTELPKHLRVEEIVIEPQEKTEGMVKIGALISQSVEYSPASLYIKRIIRPKYVDKTVQEPSIHIAPLPDRALNKCIAAASLLSHIMVSKFVDHLPFYRQRQMMIRDYKWHIDKSTVNNWFFRSCELLKPLYEELKQQVLQSGYLQADESPIRVLDKRKKGKTHQGYQWVYRSVEKRLVLFDYQPGRGAEAAKCILKDYQGYLQCDGYVVYQTLANTNKAIKLLACWAHVRRKFFDAQGQDGVRAQQALQYIQAVYAHEKISKDYTYEQRYEYRLKHVQPIYGEFKNWLDKNSSRVLPKSVIAKAIFYALNQWPKLERILEQGRFEIDNNQIENKIRPLALGRKNYLFAGSHAAAQRIAMMYSFFATCKNQGINPYEWLKTTLEKLPQTKLSKLNTLMPSHSHEV